LVDQERRTGGLDGGTVDQQALRIAHLHPAALDHGPVTVFEIADRVGERCKRDCVGAEIHLAGTMTDREWRAAARADHQIVFAGKDEGERESAAQTRQRPLHRVDGRQALFICAVTACATTSVSVSVPKMTPAFSSSSRNSRKFSMMPLCTTASL